ncbi:hypothetical protein ANO11243_088820 [Dothideomycetidae sp. 11243]|nr:hypothetical protein ANO11243_088820 [fungal sp. No.11243]
MASARKKRAALRTNQKPGGKHARPGSKPRGIPAPSPAKATDKSTTKKPQSSNTPTQTPLADPYDPRATIPFDLLTDTILLVGEGDLSFTRSLVETHFAPSVTATTYDSLPVLESKYPSTAAANISAIQDADPDAVILHGVDATRLSTTKALKGKKFDRVVFNFPHVGGLTKDVNRQVRLNQELLVGFFKGAKGLLTSEGTVVVTLFVAEPYTLWNVRDLARHSGLEVVRSFRFDPAVYPGYAHARTLGVVEGGGGWKGEDREARSYVFRKKPGSDDDNNNDDRPSSTTNKRKRTHGDSSDDDD